MLEAEIGYRAPPSQRFLRVFLSGATPGYLATIATVTGLLLALPLLAGHTAGMSPGALALLGLLAVIPASDLALALINRAVMDLIGPTPLPRLELAEGVPASMRTLVVVPTLLTERRRDRGAHQSPGDPLSRQPGRPRPLRPALGLEGRGQPSACRRTIGSSRWPRTASPASTRAAARRLPAATRFLLLHRRRVWNAREGTWMGWERKRGKLEQLNQLLTGTGRTRRSRRRGARRPRCPPESATSSPSTPTRACRAARSIASSGRWPIR